MKGLSLIEALELYLKMLDMKTFLIELYPMFYLISVMKKYF